MDVKILNGEIIVKGDGVMIGYYKNPDDDAIVMAYGNQADLFPKD